MMLRPSQCKLLLLSIVVQILCTTSHDSSHHGEAIPSTCMVTPHVKNGKPASCQTSSGELVPKWLHHAALCYKGSYHCGASVIAPDWIITAAHCVREVRSPSKYRIKLRSFKRRRDGCSKNANKFEKLVDVAQIIIHPAYRSRRFQHDVALLKLATPIEFDNYTKPIPLPIRSPPLKKDDLCIVIGWGASDWGRRSNEVLNEAQLPILSRSECKQLYPWIGPDMLCAGGNANDSHTCPGDSGGSLVCRGDDGWELRGIVSFGRRGTCDKPSGFANVERDLGFVEEEMRPEERILNMKVVSGVVDGTDQLELCPEGWHRASYDLQGVFLGGEETRLCYVKGMAEAKLFVTDVKVMRGIHSSEEDNCPKGLEEVNGLIQTKVIYILGPKEDIWLCMKKGGKNPLVDITAFGVAKERRGRLGLEGYKRIDPPVAEDGYHSIHLFVKKKPLSKH